MAKYGKIDFEHLDPLIRDLLVDYSGATRKFLQRCVVNNDLDCLRGVISDSSRWPTVPNDRFRRRVEELNRTTPPPAPSPNT
jgi:hypothetical protein